MKNIIIGVAIMLTLMCGCKSYYQESGVSITAGDVTAPLDMSDGADIINIKALFSMTGAKVWATRGNAVYMKYKCVSTNNYFHLVDDGMEQETEMVVVPTNATPTVVSSLERLLKEER